LQYKEWDWDAWTTLDVEGDITIGQLIDQFKEKYGITLDFVNYDTAILFADFFAPDKIEQRKSML
jgi:hypothetical protein